MKCKQCGSTSADLGMETTGLCSGECAHKWAIAELKGQLLECMDMLDNVKYWDTCPDAYKERIEKLQ